MNNCGWNQREMEREMIQTQVFWKDSGFVASAPCCMQSFHTHIHSYGKKRDVAPLGTVTCFAAPFALLSKRPLPQPEPLPSTIFPYPSYKRAENREESRRSILKILMISTNVCSSHLLSKKERNRQIMRYRGKEIKESSCINVRW